MKGVVDHTHMEFSDLEFTFLIVAQLQSVHNLVISAVVYPVVSAYSIVSL